MIRVRTILVVAEVAPAASVCHYDYDTPRAIPQLTAIIHNPVSDRDHSPPDRTIMYTMMAALGLPRMRVHYDRIGIGLGCPCPAPILGCFD
jgi:hypothetical protein